MRIQQRITQHAFDITIVTLLLLMQRLCSIFAVSRQLSNNIAKVTKQKYMERIYRKKHNRTNITCDTVYGTLYNEYYSILALVYRLIHTLQ